MSFSILLPFRNAAATLRETLQTIQEQSFTEFELVAVDDQSTDDCRKMVSEFADSRFRILDSPGSGLVDALNYGIQQSRHEWVVRMDADDLMHPDRLKQLSRAILQHPHCDLIAHQVKMFPEKELLSGYREYIRWQNEVISEQQIANSLYIEAPFAHPAVMYRKSTVLNLGGYRESDFPEDYDLWFRMHYFGCKMVKIPFVLLDWRDSTHRLSRTHTRYRRDAFDKLRAHYLQQDPRLDSNRALAIWGAGRITRKRCNLLLQYGFPVTAWIDIDPRKIGNQINGIPVVDYGWLKNRSPRPFVLNYVTNHGARDEITAILSDFDYVEGRDFLSVG